MKFLPKLILGFALGWGLGFAGAAFTAQRLKAILPVTPDPQQAALAEIIHPPQNSQGR